MTEPGDDRELKDFMNRDSEVSRRYRAVAIEEPPADIDRAVLAQARAAVKPLPPAVTRLPVRTRTRWMVPFALAATVLLSFAIFREAGVGTGLAPLESAAPVDQVTTVILEGPGAGSMQPPAAMATPPEQTRKLNEETRREADTRAKSAGNVAGTAVTAPISVPVAPVVPPQETTTGEPVSAPATNAIQIVATQRSPAAAPPSAEFARSAADAEKQEARAPEVWLEEIRKLRAGGHATEADAELARFLELNPEYFDRNPDVAKP